MRIYLLLFFCLTAAAASAQNLVFDKLVTQSEDHWVAFAPRNDTDSYTLGFVYIDSMAGLTLEAAGSFKEVGGHYLLNNPFKDQSVKMRLSESRARVAWIPQSRLQELGVEAVPSWLHFYKGDSNSVGRMVRWGYLYNEYEQPAIALRYLKRALEKDPNYPGLSEEMAFSYNVLKDYDAVVALLNKYSANSRNCYASKELAYAYQHKDDLDGSARVYRQTVEFCKQGIFLAEMAYNLAATYYGRKDKSNFALWAAEARRWLPDSGTHQYSRALNRMEAQLAQ